VALDPPSHVRHVEQLGHLSRLLDAVQSRSGGAPALMLLSVECANSRLNGRNASLLSSLCAVCEAMRSMMCMERLTDLDERLLAALRNDGRAPIAALATRLGVSRA